MSALRAYEGTASAWASGPERIYAAIAELVVERTLGRLDGRLVCDLGAGTGCVSRAVSARGGRPVALDAALDMVAWRRSERPPGVVGDVLALPFAGGSFDAAVASFVFNHVEDPASAFAEAARVTAEGGLVVAAAFATANEHPAKALIDRVAQQHGYVRPSWHGEVKRYEERLGSADVAADAACRGGLCDVRAEELVVPTGVRTAADLVDWRLGMPYHAAFLAGLAPSRREEVRRDALAALGDGQPPYEPRVVLVTGRAAARSRPRRASA